MQFIGTGDRILTENFNVGYLYTITFKTGIYINSACIGIGDTFVMFQKAEPDLLFTLNVDTANDVDTIELYDSGGGTNNYDDLVNRPQINSHILTGNMSASDLGLQDTISDLDTIRAGAAAGATAVQPADMTSALATKQDALSTAQLAAVNSGITSTDVAQIGLNKNNISLLQWGTMEKSNSNPTADVWYYTGISFEVPAEQIYTLQAIDRSSKCTGIAIADNNTDITTSNSIIGINVPNLSDYPVEPWTCSVSCITPKYNSTLTFYVWVRRSQSLSNVATQLAAQRIK